LNLRLMKDGFAARLLWQCGAAETPWKEQVESLVRQEALAPGGRPEPAGSAGAFLVRHYAPEEGEVQRVAEVYEKYRDWAAALGVEPVSENMFGREVRRVFGLRSRGHHFTDGTHRAWPGLRRSNGT